MPDPHDAYMLLRPTAAALPIVLDSPHSGSAWPADFDTVLPHALLREAEDSHVDQLYATAPEMGATLLAARFPRVYIDPNRAEDDIDEALLDAPWPGPVSASEKTRLGIGLVWRLFDGRPIYARLLGVGEIRHRIEHCWRPYHAVLSRELEAALQRFGARWHLNLHSMPDDSYRRLGLPERPLADVVLGNRDGTTADEATMALLERSLRGAGYSVARNEPFKGVEIIRRSGEPARGCHAVQIELKKSLYMDAATNRPHAGFDRLQRALQGMLGDLAAHVRAALKK
jgi:N-formylglutamate deformylase